MLLANESSTDASTVIRSTPKPPNLSHLPLEHVLIDVFRTAVSPIR